jgi:DNA-binding CsgD family transcriptional regulator
VTEGELTSVVADFQAAGLGGSWMKALDGLARVTGSRSGQLIGIGRDGAVPFNWVTEVPEDGLRDFVELNGGDPRVNPRVRAGMRSADLQVLTEADYLAPGEMERLPIYADFFFPLDIPFICQTNLVQRPDTLIGLSVLRTRRQGLATAEQKRVFEALAPHVLAAVRTQMSLQEQGAKLVAGALEAVSTSVFVCDAQGRVRAMTPDAERLVAAGSHLRLQGGRLQAYSEADTRALTSGLRAAAFAKDLSVKHAPTVFVIRDATGVDPLLVEIAPVPGDQQSFGFGVAALLIVRTPRSSHRDAAMARALYGLTQAEMAVVADMLSGYPAEEIARRSGTSVSTVRTHIRHILEKAGARSQVQLIATITSRG